MIRQACIDFDIEKCLRIGSAELVVSPKNPIAHRLVHIKSQYPYNRLSSNAVFASATALNTMIYEHGKISKYRMEQLLATCEGNPLTASLCGLIFEPFAMEMLEKGGTFKCRQLVSGRTKKMPETVDITIPPSTSARIVVDKVEKGQASEQLYVPKSKIYVALDAWIPNIGGFQMTVGKNHDIKGQAVDDLKILNRCAQKLFFVVPPPYYKTFTKKTPQQIDQNALKIPYPEAIVSNE